MSLAAGTSRRDVVRDAHAMASEEVLAALHSSAEGLSGSEAGSRLLRFGPNRLDPPRGRPWWSLVAHQFASPLIYILIGAAVVALLLGENADAGFIAVVLVLNAVIGFVNEASAERKVRSLAGLVRSRARVRRGGNTLEIDGEDLVPGDVVLLESGDRVPADLRVLESTGLRTEEGLLTGESVPVDKSASPVPAETPLAERDGMAFAGTLVVSGRAVAVTAATGTDTELGSIARQMAEVEAQPPPLIVRMGRFARTVGLVALVVSALVVVLGLLRGQPLDEVLLGAIALAVSAVPEGLPVALTVALAVAVSRMASRKVVVRHLPAVEALGSCGVIATDKTGTLTRNELTVERMAAGSRLYELTGVGYEPVGDLLLDGRPVPADERGRIHRLLRAAVLANEATLEPRVPDEDVWVWTGDPTDVALLSAARKTGVDPTEVRRSMQEVAVLPFEPERRYSASFRRAGNDVRVYLKGAPERILEMCDREAGEDGGEPTALDARASLAAVEGLMAQGYRVLAVAESPVRTLPHVDLLAEELSELILLGFLAMADPPREGVEEAMTRCRGAGIRVIMITGDHAVTASAIAARIGLASSTDGALEGSAIEAMDDLELTEALEGRSVVARATPVDKLRVVTALQEGGAFVAVTGDGVNDAPALRRANLGVAMGRSGTDVAREAAELVLTDDNFASIVAGIEEGRVAYDNVRKVTYLLVSTGAGEVLLVLAAVAAGLPVPLTAAQLLWLNLVTNGIQDVALAFEPGEPGVLERPPRRPDERMFDRIMIERTLIAGLTFATLGLACWIWWLHRGLTPEEARNLLVQLFVLFEVMHIGNARSETTSLFRLSPFRNRVLLLGTAGAIGVHLAALHTPFFQSLLGISPIAWTEWLQLSTVASLIVLVMEVHKKIRGHPNR